MLIMLVTIILKIQLSKQVRIEYAEHVRKYFPGNAPFRSSSSFIASTGTAGMGKVKEYREFIDRQVVQKRIGWSFPVRFPIISTLRRRDRRDENIR